MSGQPTIYSRAILILSACFLGLFYVYHSMILSNFAFITGDIYDGKIMISILEHWKNVFSFREWPLTPNYYYPFPNGSTYGDALLFTGFIYSIYRIFLDPFVSYEMMNFTIRIIGGIGTYFLARRLFNLNSFYALFCCFLSIIVTSLTYRMAHAQLLYTAFVPWGLVFFQYIFGYITMVAGGKASLLRALILIVLFACFIGFWALSGFYTLYIFCLFLTIYFLAQTALSKEAMTACRLIFAKAPLIPSVAIASIGAALGLVLLIYSLSETSGFSAGGLSFFSAAPVNVLNVGVGNVVWSNIVNPIIQGFTGVPVVNGELTTGFTPALLFAFFTASIVAFKRYMRRRDQSSAIVLALVISCLLIATLTFKIAGFVLWEPIFRFLPGANALRVPARFMLFISPVVIVIAIYGISLGFRPSRSQVMTPVGLVLLGFICFEQYRNDLPIGLDRATEMAVINSVPPVPTDCRSFYVSVPRLPMTNSPGIDSFYLHSVDAMLLAEINHLPTVLGMTSLTPDGWDLHSPYAPDYEARVLAYADRMSIRDGLCALDLKAMTWTNPRE